MQDPTSSAVFFTSRCWDENVKGLVSIFLVPTSGLILKGYNLRRPICFFAFI